MMENNALPEAPCRFTSNCPPLHPILLLCASPVLLSPDALQNVDSSQSKGRLPYLLKWRCHRKALGQEVGRGLRSLD